MKDRKKINKIKEKENSSRFIIALKASIKSLIYLICILNFFSPEKVHLLALASSSFAAFIPKLKTSRTKNLLGSYIIAILIGMFFSYLLHIPFIENFSWSLYLCGGITVALTIFIEIFLSLEHPPSAGAALGFVIAPWTISTPITILVAIVLLSFYRDLLNTLEHLFNKEKKKS